MSYSEAIKAKSHTDSTSPYIHPHAYIYSPSLVLYPHGSADHRKWYIWMPVAGFETEYSELKGWRTVSYLERAGLLRLAEIKMVVEIWGFHRALWDPVNIVALCVTRQCSFVSDYRHFGESCCLLLIERSWHDLEYYWFKWSCFYTPLWFANTWHIIRHDTYVCGGRA